MFQAVSPETCRSLTVKLKLYNAGSFWLFLKKTLTMHGPMNVKLPYTVVTTLLCTVITGTTLSPCNRLLCSLITDITAYLYNGHYCVFLQQTLLYSLVTTLLCTVITGTTVSPCNRLLCPFITDITAWLITYITAYLYNGHYCVFLQQTLLHTLITDSEFCVL